MKHISAKLALTFLIAALCSFHFVVGQNNYEEGHVYFKVKDKVSFNIRSKPNTGQVNLDEATFLGSIIKKYNVISLKRPFFIAKAEKIQRIFELSFTMTNKTEDLLKELAALNIVEYAERVPVIRPINSDIATNFFNANKQMAPFTPNDPNYSSQQAYLSSIKVPEAWGNYTKGNKKIIVCVIDNAIEINHPDLQGQLWVNPDETAGNNTDDDQNGLIDDINGWDFSANNDNNPSPPAGQSSTGSWAHGTCDAGIATATANNSKGVAGIGFNVSLMAVKVFKDDGATASSSVYNGVLYAGLKGAHVVCMSLGTGQTFSATEQAIIDFAYSLGVVIVAAAGNEGTSVTQYPAAYKHVIAVASLENPTDVKRSASSYGSWVDIAAPGTQIWGPHLNGTYAPRTGTSQAGPIVAGVCALIKSYNPYLTPLEVENCLKNGAININSVNQTACGGTSCNGKIGAGKVNAEGALMCASGLTNPCSGVGLSLPFTETFESATFPPAGWKIWNPDDSLSWTRTTVATRPGSSGSIRINNYNYSRRGELDDIMLPALNLSNVSNAVLRFKVAYAKFSPLDTARFSEELGVYVSTDCGATFNPVYYKRDKALITFPSPGGVTTDFIPTQQQWREETVDLTQYTSSSNVIIRFSQYSDYENNLYIDDISVSNSVGIEETANEKTLSVFPNPSSGSFTVTMKNPVTNAASAITVYNAYGQLIEQHNGITFNAQGQYPIHLEAYPDGIYFVEVATASERMIQKVNLIK